MPNNMSITSLFCPRGKIYLIILAIFKNMQWYNIDDVYKYIKNMDIFSENVARDGNYSSRKLCKMALLHVCYLLHKIAYQTTLTKHFKAGCPNDTGRDKATLDFTLLDYIDTTQEKLALANHEPGPKCRCSECEKLKALEDAWILKLGTFYEKGLNTRDEVKSKSRCNW